MFKSCYFAGTTLPGGLGNPGPQMVNGDYDNFDDRFRKVSGVKLEIIVEVDLWFQNFNN